VVDFIGPAKAEYDPRAMDEYRSATYFNLYRARSYDLFGDYPKADRIYTTLLDTENFKEDAIFFKTKILLETKRFSELRDYMMNVHNRYAGNIETSAGYKIAYSIFIEHYLERFYLTDNWQLQKMYNFTEPEVEEVKAIYKNFTDSSMQN
jgi:hypothetical protein